MRLIDARATEHDLGPLPVRGRRGVSGSPIQPAITHRESQAHYRASHPAQVAQAQRDYRARKKAASPAESEGNDGVTTT